MDIPKFKVGDKIVYVADAVGNLKGMGSIIGGVWSAAVGQWRYDVVSAKQDTVLEDKIQLVAKADGAWATR